MFVDNNDDVSSVYDFHLLSGHYLELDELPEEQISMNIAKADELSAEAKNKKGTEKTSTCIAAMEKYTSALALLDKCEISDTDALFAFICIRHPELELDFGTLRKMIMLQKNKTMDYQEQKTMDVAVSLYTASIKRLLTAFKLGEKNEL